MCATATAEGVVRSCSGVVKMMIKEVAKAWVRPKRRGLSGVVRGGVGVGKPQHRS